MSEETQTQETENQTPAPEVQEGESELEKAKRHKLEAQKREQATKDKFAAYKAEQARLKKEADEKKLAEQGEYKTLLDKREAEYKAEIAKRDSELLRRDLRDKLRHAAPRADDIFLDWAADRFSGNVESMDEYINSLRENELTADRFKEIEEPQPPGHKPPQAASVSGAGTNKTLDERVVDGDINAINQKLQDMVNS